MKEALSGGQAKHVSSVKMSWTVTPLQRLTLSPPHIPIHIQNNMRLFALQQKSQKRTHAFLETTYTLLKGKLLIIL